MRLYHFSWFLSNWSRLFQSSSSEGVNMLTLIFSLSIAILITRLDSIQWMWVNFKCIKSLPIIYPIYLILHFNVTIIVWLVPQLNASTFFFGSSVVKLSLALHPCLVPRSLSLLFAPSQAIKSHLVLNHCGRTAWNNTLSEVLVFH